MDENNNIKISFTGDMLCYERMSQLCKTDDAFDYSQLFEGAKGVFVYSDYVVANLETPVAGQKLGFTNERYRFNTPTEYLNAVKDMGADLVTLANNHCMDRGESGIDATLDSCERAGLSAIGIYRDRESRDEIFVRDIGGIKVSFINYTYGSNAFAHHEFLKADSKYKVNLTQPEETLEGAIDLLRDAESIKQNVQRLYGTKNDVYDSVLSEYLKRIRTDIAKAKMQSDLVVFCLHSGGQYNELPDEYTKMLAETIKKAGADIIIGLHPHIIQPSSVENDFVTVYCMGNFMFQPSVVENNPPVNPAFNTVVHVYADRTSRKLSKVTFSLMKVVEGSDGIPKASDSFDLLGAKSGEATRDEILHFADLFGNGKYDEVEMEYLMWEITSIEEHNLLVSASTDIGNFGKTSKRCPRCGNEIISETIGTSYTIRCKSNHCIYADFRGI